jgi:hypothetical protein
LPDMKLHEIVRVQVLHFLHYASEYIAYDEWLYSTHLNPLQPPCGETLGQLLGFLDSN